MLFHFILDTLDRFCILPVYVTFALVCSQYVFWIYEGLCWAVVARCVWNNTEILTTMRLLHKAKLQMEQNNKVFSLNRRDWIPPT